jgi:uncharacterized DUF497 family protein
MRFEFDSAKDATNREKHEVSLLLAVDLEWEAARVWTDDRFDYGESRMIALAPVGGTVYYVAFVDRDQTRRIISLRRANRREKGHYAKYSEASGSDHADPQ